MRKFAVTFLFSLFLGIGVAMAGGGDFDSDQQRQVPQGKIVINVPPPENDWIGPALGAVGVIAAAGIGVYATRRNRKGK